MRPKSADPWAEPKRYPRPPIQAHGMTRDERLAEANKVLEGDRLVSWDKGGRA